MRIAAIMLALAAILGHQPSPPSMPKMLAVPGPDGGAERVWNLTLPEAIRAELNKPLPCPSIILGALVIPVDGCEPYDPSVGPKLPLVHAKPDYE